jgi:hypothetical protein
VNTVPRLARILRGERARIALTGLALLFCMAPTPGDVPVQTAFPDRCVPLVHDGEVCLRALQYASCDDYRAYVSDVSPSVPTECNFCPEPAP